MRQFWKEVRDKLGLPPTVTLEPLPEDGVSGPPAVLDIGGTSRFLYLTLRNDHAAAAQRAMLSMRVVEPEAHEPAHRSSKQTPLAILSSASREPIAPFFYCRHKDVWVVATPASAVERLTPLATLWHRVRDDRSGASEDAPACSSCERRDICYRPTDNPEAPLSAKEALVEIMARPWTGALVQNLDVPLPAWLDLVDSSADVPPSFGGVPFVHRRQLQQRFESSAVRLTAEADPRRQLAERIILRLGVFRQLLRAVASARQELERPHSDLRPERVWVRFPPDSPSDQPVLWASQLALVEGTGNPPPDYPDELTPSPPRARVEIEGNLLPPGEECRISGHPAVRYLFLPQTNTDSALSPKQELAVVLQEPEGGSKVIRARVEIAFEDLIRLNLFPGSYGKDGLDELIKTSTQIKIRIGGDSERVDPDLHAIGVLWLAGLTGSIGALGHVAKLRRRAEDDLRVAGIDRDEHDRAEDLCWESFSAGGGLVAEVRAEASHAPLSLLVARCLWFGMRMCMALPADIPPPTYYETLDREFDALMSTARHLMVGPSGPEEEIAAVIQSVREALGK